MSAATTIIAESFGEGADLYTDVLEITKEATPAQLRKAYYRKALQYHPDKNPGFETKFQAVSLAYEILKDAERRAEYDETGEFVEETADATSTEAWKTYFDSIFGKITTNDIDKFASKYKCSSEEEGDVLQNYTRFKGNLVKILDCVMLSEPRDTRRWVEDYIRPAIDRGEVKDYSKTLDKTLQQCMAQLDSEEKEDDKVVDEDATESEDSEPRPPKSKRQKKATATKAVRAKKKSKQQREAGAAEELMAKIQNKQALSRRKEGFDAMFAGIKERYGVEDDDPLAGADFEAIQAQMLSNNKRKSSKN